MKIRGNNHFYNDLNPHNKETILLIHGHPFDQSMWNYQRDALKDFRLLLPDLKGYGKTDYKFDKIFIEEQALDLALLLDKLEIAQVHLIGLSMGGQIMIEFARLFPHRILSLVLCDSNPSAENDARYQQRLKLAERIAGIGMKAYTDGDIHKYLHADTIANNNAVYNHLYQMMVATHTEGAVASHRGRAERRDNLDYLQHIKVPVLVMAGDSDFFTPVEEMKDIAGRFASADLVTIPGAGHMPNMEQPGYFNKAVLEFYAQHAII